ncbi:ATP synthase F1 subunit gamma [Planctomyces sp. SH-PL62]|uniref:ATP synthase F1 subunit gamma n=1 Tax=Planctomyces sp. SH-PL62 TaxID=1636152 RepID=UPI00078BE62D|nr:ATP synthase F1 subunit gamma [Planctomyces sp. SH-PL62]AMV36684.1 ATP synthase gamma chain [Planctomyces sp. SH-PL62]
MAKARAIIKRRKAVDNIRKITRTMELIATARFRKAMDRAVEAEAYTKKIAEMAADLGESSPSTPHPLFEKRDPVRNSLLLVLSSNRGLAGGYNGNVLRAALKDYQDLQAEGSTIDVEISGKRGQNFWKYRKLPISAGYLQFEDKPAFGEVEQLAERYLAMFLEGKIDRMDVAYTRFVNTARQEAVVRTLLPIQVDAADADPTPDGHAPAADGPGRERTPYEFLPDAEGILKEMVPVSFKVRLFKCFLDAAVSEQIARMVAMKGASQNADELSKNLTRQYNRARQSQITGDLADIVGAATALK